MRFASYGDFARYLGTVGELHRVTVEVDPYLEITEIATRALKEGKPAIWFDNVKGARFPLVINAMASERRCELALQKHPGELGRELIAMIRTGQSSTFPVWRTTTITRSSTREITTAFCSTTTIRS